MIKARVEFEEQTTLLSFTDGRVLSMNIGYQTLIEHDFNQRFPTPYTTELAITTIEDEIARAIANWQPGQVLVTHNKHIGEMITHFKLGNLYTNRITTEQVEHLFNRFVGAMSGAPWQSTHLPESIEFIAILVIVRELLHHLGIEGIELI
ncbi:hypothetical protein DES39_0895 [Orbus hercynius]|uniref:Uncharacterized protein n=1 Tax=Orbus hercynius TaxID=593135 RepID=A0A495RK11_9GAMM|nr:hypothetical protein [Orbus hercynius]RKS87654.1 hypothetical protein DES39_0895 [Orbus hercynius]